MPRCPTAASTCRSPSQDGRIVEVAPGLAAPAHETVAAGGLLVAPPFCDPHFHMDATLRYGLPRVNASGTLLEGIALWGELKPLLTAEALIERALALLRLGGGQGPARDPHPRRHQRSERPGGRRAARGARRVAPYLDLQLVAFPQDGVLRSPGGIDQPGARARPRRRRRRRHPALRAHHGRRRGERRLLCEIAARARPAGRHALRRDRRPALAPHRDARLRDAAARPAGPRQRLALHLHAQHGQLLRLQAAAADRRGGRERGRQSADQHHASRAGTTAIRSGAA